MVGQPALLAAHFGETQSGTAKFLRNWHDEILRSAEFFEILIEKAIFAVVGSGTGIETGQHLVCETMPARKLGRSTACFLGASAVA
jgi:hypothetical protein